MSARLPALALPVGGGLAMAAATPPFDLVPGVLVGLAALALSVRSAPSVRAAFVRGLVWAAVGGVVGMRFVPEVLDRFAGAELPVGILALVALSLFQALGWAVGAAVCVLLVRRTGLPFPAAFGAGALVAASAPGVFTWTPAAYLLPWPELVQAAELVGDRGLSVALAVLAAGAVHGIGRGRAPLAAVRPAALALGVVVVAAVAGSLRMDAVLGRPGEQLRVALVDHRAGANERSDPARQGELIGRLRGLSSRADAAGADVVVWPEAAYPVPLDRGTREIDGGSASPLAPGAVAPRLIGLTTFDARGGRRREFNSTTIVTPDGRVQPPADKLRLLPFGETLPFGDLLPPLRAWFARRSGVTAGEGSRPLLLARPGAEPVRIGILNCYEDMHAPTARRVVADADPQLLVNVSNDAWFAGTVAAEQHARLSGLRAVELRTDLVRAVNGGGGSWIDAAGRVRARQTGAGPNVAITTPALRDVRLPPTVYAQVGDWPLRLALGLWLIAAAIRAALARLSAARRRPSASTHVPALP